MERKEPLGCVFFETAGGNQPVRDFLLALSRENRKEIGADIFKVQEGFPMGLPLVEKMDRNLWEIRSTLPEGICRTFFTIHDQTMVLLHSFIKKTQKTPARELNTAKERLQEFRRLSK